MRKHRPGFQFRRKKFNADEHFRQILHAALDARDNFESLARHLLLLS